MWRGMPYRQVFDDPGSGKSVVSGNRWDQPGVPHKGWHCVDVVDLRADGESADETDYATCQMCGNEKIRYVHIMEHPDLDENFEVGCVCAEKMSDDYEGRMDLRDVKTVLAQLSAAFEHFNEVHPHSSLKMRSPREFRRQRAEQVRQEPSTDQAVYCD